MEWFVTIKLQRKLLFPIQCDIFEVKNTFTDISDDIHTFSAMISQKWLSNTGLTINVNV